VYEAVMNLQNQLSIAQESTLSNFALDQYIPALLEILKKPPVTDFSNEINSKQKLLVIQYFIFSVCNSMSDEPHGHLPEHFEQCRDPWRCKMLCASAGVKHGLH